ncbi:hypothetical protein [Kitasatospora sp. NPDC005856]|uniref:hypothetical protein n=1 Tax=Kitasatospora sp. NPDC005856 TaxID=3154566 RepID=UPI00340B7EF6
MAAPVTARDLLGRRLARAARHLAAATIALGTWTLLSTQAFEWITAIDKAGFAPVLSVLAGALATAIDLVLRIRGGTEAVYALAIGARRHRHLPSFAGRPQG